MNATLTYRSDSEMYHPYDIIKRRTNITGTEYIPTTHWQNKTGSVVWLVSDCTTKSKRETIVKELAKYIDVDVFGRCTNKRCNDTSTKCVERYARNYKFYLSFENSMCKDYVTEKLFNALRAEIIPVVFGGANYAHYAPNGSYINVMDFKSPRELARFLQNLGTHERNYYRYFHWKTEYEFNHKYIKFCQICEALNYGLGDGKHVYKLNNWWRSGICDRKFVKLWQQRW